jgi:hypothetical protein
VAKSKNVKSERTGRVATTAHRYNIKEVTAVAKVSVATVSRTLAMPDVVLPAILPTQLMVRGPAAARRDTK